MNIIKKLLKKTNKAQETQEIQEKQEKHDSDLYIYITKESIQYREEKLFFRLGIA